MVSDGMEDTGKSMILRTVTWGLLVVSSIVVILRIMVRVKIRAFGADDWTMVAAQVFFVGTAVSTITGSISGIGVKDRYLTEWDQVNVKRHIIVFQVFQLGTLIFVKSSICWALLRLTIHRSIKIILYCIAVLNIISALTAFFFLFVQCRPFRATWVHTEGGTCAGPSVIIDISYFVSACSIVTDFSCSILPSYMLWGLQMKRNLKITVSAILGLGFLASSATIVRLFFLESYTVEANYAYNVSDICVWSVVESGIAIAAGSAPALRPLLRSIALFKTTENSASDIPRGKKRSDSMYALGSIGTPSNRAHISAKGGKSPYGEETESMKDILREEGVIITSEIIVEDDEISSTQNSFTSYHKPMRG